MIMIIIVIIIVIIIIVIIIQTCIKGNICLDPDASEEENDTNSKFMLSYMPSLKQITHVLCTGKMEAELSIEVC